MYVVDEWISSKLIQDCQLCALPKLNKDAKLKMQEFKEALHHQEE